jgi:hypothetical protein
MVFKEKYKSLIKTSMNTKIKTARFFKILMNSGFSSKASKPKNNEYATKIMTLDFS